MMEQLAQEKEGNKIYFVAIVLGINLMSHYQIISCII